MPAIQVARTDTFEQQRQKINQIGNQIFNISAGGSDLATGNLKLGDGSKNLPSLSFVNQDNLGFYKSDNSEVSWVSNGKNLITFKSNEINSFQNLNIRKRTLIPSGLSIQSSGENYDTGNYSNIDLLGGSGSFGLVDLVVEAYEGQVTSAGSNYLTGSYTDIFLNTTGNGSDILVEFSTITPQFAITSPGSGYIDGEYFSINASSSGIGTGLVVDLTISGGSITSLSISNAGQRHLVGDTFTVSNDDIAVFDTDTGETTPNTGSGFQFAISNTPNSIDPDTLVFTNKGSGTVVGDIFTTPIGKTATGDLPGSVLGLSTTLNSASAQITVSSTSGILSGMQVSQVGGDGQIANFTTVQSVDSSTTLTLSQPPSVDGTAILDFFSDSTNTIVINNSQGIVNGSYITGGGYSGTISSVDTDTNTIGIFPDSTSASLNVTFTITPPYGGGTGFEYTVNKVGVISDITLVGNGSGYAIGDVLSVRSIDLIKPIPVYVNVRTLQRITLASPIPVFVGDNVNTYTPPDLDAGTPALYGVDLEVVEIVSGSNGSATSFICTAEVSLSDGQEFVINGTGTVYTVLNSFSEFRYLMGFDENNLSQNPNLTLYANNKYDFIQNDGSYGAHPLQFSNVPDGTSNVVENVTSTLSTASNIITVSNSSGIYVGMGVSVSLGDGTLSLGTTVESIVGTTVTLSENPTSDGAATLTFSGVKYSENVEETNGSVVISITELTPNPLYYYCPNHPNVGGQHTINANNPKTFGSGFELLVTDVDIIDVISSSVSDGALFALSFSTSEIETETLISTTSIESPLSVAGIVRSNSIESNSGSNLSLSSSNNLVINAGKIIYSNIELDSANSNFTTAGEIKTTLRLNVNDVLTINNNTISTNSLNDLVLTPGFSRIAKVDANTAFVIPVGNTSQRPASNIVQSGSIRFNDQTNQFEGYSSINGSWSSLGGVRDLDGNTTILAEEFVGANDNTLWFINDNINTLKLSKNYLTFEGAKKIRSANTSAPDYVNWTANTPVSAGTYLKYQNNIFEVITGGVTATSGNEPTDISGNTFANGSSVLQYAVSAVSQLTFEEISQINIDPLGFTNLVVNGELRFSKNIISTNINDLVIRPNTGRKIVCDSKTHLQIPAGTDSEKSTGTARNGSIRYNITNQVYEGFSETTNTWGSLGGVKDVDQNTYIIPETSPGANENILYFFNDNINTIQLTTTALDFTNINVIACSFDDSLEVTAATVTFDNSATTIDNTVSDTTFIHTSKDKLDLGLSTGLTVDPLLRLDDQGDIYYNTGFGSGSQSLIRIFDRNLSSLELSEYRITTSSSALLKGTTNNGSAVLYNPSTELSAKVEFIAHNVTTGDKEIIEFSVIDKGSDILYTEIGTIQTGNPLITYTLDFNVNNAVRLNYSLATGVANANVVNVTVVSNVIKK